ncbi:MAG: nucleotidyl transferase AbiEii/AbiGii toxin family protein [Bdellovibrionales bacterium]|nr:nucleotidyl transferase AbiEii/AbiGii toxin family protein [Bdellovibrionales bacterium]
MSREENARKIRIELTQLANRKDSWSINELRIVLGLERIVARLIHHKELEKHLVYKGGFVLLKALGSDRFTRDLDALGVGIDKDEVEKLVPLALDADIQDGFWFGDVQIKPLDEQGEYGALRFDCAFQIGDPQMDKLSKLSRLHFDVGFGDTIPTELANTSTESLLKGESPIYWKVYPPEFIFSEKLQTLVERASSNSRGKDVYDLALLFDKCENKKSLNGAVKATFKTRETDIPGSFHYFAKGLNLRQIEASWRSVRIAQELDFETVWKRTLAMLKKFDEGFKA